jgi:hypothetical protein
MATKAYNEWVADGRPWKFARPVRDLGDRLAAHGYTVYFQGDERHLTKDTPEDHTPFSETGWPVKSPYPVCVATDVMPPAAGQKSKLTGRPLPALTALAARLRTDKMNGVPGAAWVKYMNWEPGDGTCVQDSWKPGYARRDSTDRGHIHVSGRSDMIEYTGAAGYDLVARTEGGGMPLWGWDASHYDAVPSAAKVYGEGFRFMTHKAGGDKDDAELAAWWTAMKGYRDRMLLGAYWVQYPGNATGRADAFLARLDSQCPGWRDGPFILQVDCEIWGGDTSTKPGLTDIRAFCQRLAAKMPKLRPIVYAPKWAYADGLTGLGFPLWASSYVTGTGAASTLYPSDSSTRWGSYSGQVPAVLQFSSSATIAGQTTCDANAYRGTLEQLTALLAPGWITTEEPEMELDDKYGSEAYTGRTVRNFTKDVHGLRDVLIGDTIGAAKAGVTPASPISKMIAAANTTADLPALIGSLGDRIVGELRAAEAAEVARDADNLTRLLTVLSTMSGTVTVDELKEALHDVFGEAFSEAETRTSAVTFRGAVADDDTVTRASREASQPRILGSGE